MTNPRDSQGQFTGSQRSASKTSDRSKDKDRSASRQSSSTQRQGSRS